MPTESASLSLLSIFSLVSFFIFLLISKYSNKIGSGVLLDSDFEKPQAFHKELTPRSGGLAAIISLCVFFILYYFLFEKFFLDYLILSIPIFLLGFLEDVKLKLSANYRLLVMISILMLFIYFFQINIQGVDVIYLSMWMKNPFFSLIFVLLCFLFIINGANLIDGFNGLLVIHLLIINIVLVFFNFHYGSEELGWLIIAQIVILFSLFFFNFPKAKIFMGDSGSYLFGSLVALNIIKTNNSNQEASSFFFCILLFYLFFEVFFSFFRKLYLKKSPMKPDKYHLHMLLFNFLEKSGKFKDSNYINSLIINLTYFFLICPAFFFFDNGLVCKYLFSFLLVIYILLYYFLSSFQKKNIKL